MKYVLSIILVGLMNLSLAIASTSSNFAILKANFKQRRAMPHLKKPLETHGVFVFIKGKGILWNIQIPYSKAVLITSNGVKNITLKEDDNDEVDGTPGFGGYVRAIGQILEAVLNSNVDVIDKIDGFECQIIKDDNRGWVKKLTPKSEQIKQFIEVITIEGSEYITRVEIQKKLGQWDELIFTEHNVCATEKQCLVLNDFEKKAFD
jgi:hypothetical protein